MEMLQYGVMADVPVPLPVSLFVECIANVPSGVNHPSFVDKSPTEQFVMAAGTKAMARQFGLRIVGRDWHGFAKLKRISGIPLKALPGRDPIIKISQTGMSFDMVSGCSLSAAVHMEP